MVEQNIQDLSTERLKKRKRFVTVILVVLVTALLANIVVGVLRERITNVVIGVALFPTGLPMLMGLKRINGELERREGG